MKYGTSIWFEDVTGHVGVPEEVRWLPRPTMRVIATPMDIPLGRPVQVSARALDVGTGSVLAGSVLINGQVAGRTDMPFTYTFNNHTQRVFDPELRIWTMEVVPPTATVTAPDYVDGVIGFDYYEPGLRIWVEPALILIGRPTQVTVRAEDTRTRVAVAGRVIVNGQDLAATNIPFTYT